MESEAAQDRSASARRCSGCGGVRRRAREGFVREAGDGVDHEAECASKGYGALIPESERSGSLAISVEGLVDALEERRADGTALLTRAFDHKQTAVDVAGFVEEFGRCSSRARTPMSAGLLMTVSMRRALPSLRYCWTRLCL